MNTRIRPFLAGLLVAGLLAGTADARTRSVTDPDAPRALPAQGAVDVRWTDPAQFTEIRQSTNRWAAQRGNWVMQLAEHVRDSASRRLPAGERLEVEITDVTRAGNYEPWRGPNAHDIRFMRDVYPPRMTLQVRRLGADGAVLAEGERKLSDMAYLMGTSGIGDSDPLRYEKRMIDRWLASELPRG